jgi:hypothetical protein
MAEQEAPPSPGERIHRLAAEAHMRGERPTWVQMPWEDFWRFGGPKIDVRGVCSWASHFGILRIYAGLPWACGGDDTDPATHPVVAPKRLPYGATEEQRDAMPPVLIESDGSIPGTRVLLSGHPLDPHVRGIRFEASMAGGVRCDLTVLDTAGDVPMEHTAAVFGGHGPVDAGNESGRAPDAAEPPPKVEGYSATPYVFPGPELRSLRGTRRLGASRYRYSEPLRREIDWIARKVQGGSPTGDMIIRVEAVLDAACHARPDLTDADLAAMGLRLSPVMEGVHIGSVDVARIMDALREYQGLQGWPRVPSAPRPERDDTPPKPGRQNA